MGFMDYRLRMLLEQCEAANRDGTLTRAMLDQTIRETMAYKEPTASDIRLLLSGLCPGVTTQTELHSRLCQAQVALHSVAKYD